MKKSLVKSFLVWIFLEIFLLSVFIFTDSIISLGFFIGVIIITAFTESICFFIGKQISVKVELPPTLKKNEKIFGEISFKNGSVFPIFKAICVMEAKNNLTGETAEFEKIVSAFSQKEKKTDFEVFSKNCGYITVRTKKIYLTDIFGFIPAEAKGFASKKAKATVLPDTFSPVIVFDSIPPVPEDSDSYSADKKGNDYSETFQIREYVQGDNIKQIHWKLSEKIDKLIVREPSLPIAKTTLLFWDKSAGENHTPEEMDAMAEVVSSIGQSFCRMGMEFAFGWGDGKADFVEEIKTAEDLIQTIPRMIKFGTEKDGEKTEGFFEKGNTFVFGKTICVSKDIPVGIEKLYGQSSVNFVLCNKKLSGDNVVSFSPESYLEDLEMLELAT